MQARIGSLRMNGGQGVNTKTILREAEAIYMERVLRARVTPPGQKLVDGFRLFERSRGLMRDGVRHQFPDATPVQVEAIVQQRLDIVREMQDGDLYRPYQEPTL